ncbi:sulfite exporter TauE/SafE family protein [Vibrio sp. JC009]|uniref:sulfite exporter TauE/SafE family protein n=1 Tax=Vibrio sp. JC009 TaxID=2912314 RepID=UPI0023AF2585|nr:sulfite exporter TauE/SafE family protein [Vibrio sp. JC009]WED22386.1 sulfite exporter TauE/SafE family protein [Vibrio sp. JC009]
MDFELLAMLLALGGIVGVLAGLLGIGGGIVVVPALSVMLPAFGIRPDIVMHIALATSLATIILTAGSSAFNHLKLGNVDFAVVKWLLPGIMTGGFAGSYIADFVPEYLLPKIFGVIVTLLGLQMLFAVRFKRVKASQGKVSTVIAGSVIGTVSALAGIGGGTIIVPYLSRYGVEMRRAVGSASVCGAVVAISGMTGFILHGVSAEHLPPYSVGYVYLPALFAIACTSVLTTKIGANLATQLPTPTLKKIFAVFLLFVAAKMLFS